MGFYRLQNDHYFNKKCIADTDVVNDVTSDVDNVRVSLCICRDGSVSTFSEFIDY